MTRTRSFMATWNHFWFRDVPPHAIALFRLMFGVFILVYWLAFIPKVDVLFSSAGLIVPRHDIALLSAVSPSIAWIIYSVVILSLILFTIGAWSGISMGIAWLIQIYYWELSLYQFGTSFDRLFLFLCLVMIFAGSDRTYSIRMKLTQGSFFAQKPVTIFWQRIIAVQVTATYLGVGLQKAILPAWKDGHIMINTFRGLWATRYAFWFSRLDLPFWFFDLLTSFIKFTEVLLPIGLWIKKLKPYAFMGGALFHVLVTIFLGMWWFLALIATYIFFIEPEEIAQKLRGITSRS